MLERLRLKSAAARATLFAALLAAAGSAATSHAQGAAPSTPPADSGAPAQPTNEELLRDFAHYVYIAQVELAEACANALLERSLAPIEFVGVVEDSPRTRDTFERAVIQGLAVPELEPAAAALNRLYEQGLRERSRDPEEIARNIALLGGNARGRILGHERLLAAKEYATPQLLEVMLARTNQTLEGNVARLLVDMGADSVIPLSVALSGVDGASQSRLAGILAQTRNSAALPYLYQVMRDSTDSTVRASCAQAIGVIQAAPADSNVSIAELFWRLGEDYYRESRGLTRFQGEDHQLLWSFDPGVGLYPTSVRTEVFHEARAMDLAERALRSDPNHEGALSLWLASNFSRAIDTPENYENPAYPASRPDALYFAVLSGPGPAQQVLARALDDRDTPLARRAIQALTMTAGDASIWAGLGPERPLLDALSYPERRVQYDAALALGRAKPTSPFPGSERVTPILAGAVRDASERFAIILASSAERQQALNDVVTARGFTVLGAGAALGELDHAIADAPGVDLIVTDLPTDQTVELIERIRSSTKMSAAPLLALLSADGWNTLWPRYETNPLTAVRREGISNDQLSESIDQLVLRASGPAVSPEEANDYALASLDVLRDLAISNNRVFNVADATLPLVGALDDSEGDVRMNVAEVLSRIDDRRAQIALLDAALKAESDERGALLARVADSVRAYGNMLEERQVRDVIALATAGDASAGPDITAAAALVGALNLAEEQVAPLILKQ